MFFSSAINRHAAIHPVAVRGRGRRPELVSGRRRAESPGAGTVRGVESGQKELGGNEQQQRGRKRRGTATAAVETDQNRMVAAAIGAEGARCGRPSGQPEGGRH